MRQERVYEEDVNWIMFRRSPGDIFADCLHKRIARLGELEGLLLDKDARIKELEDLLSQNIQQLPPKPIIS